jgi:hypothetical protein
VLCAYIAALAWLGRAEAVGDLETGYIVLPLPKGNEKTASQPNPETVQIKPTPGIKVTQSQWSYLIEEWESWLAGDRAAYPFDKRLKFWRRNRPIDQRQYQFGETYVATALMRQGFKCWTWYSLFGEPSNDEEQRSNGDEIRRLLAETGRSFDPQMICAAVQGLEKFRAPDVIAYHPRTGQWRFIEVKRTEHTVRLDQQLSLAAAKYFLDVDAEVIHLREGRGGITEREPLEVRLTLTNTIV